jgi:hypothetical protein
MENDSQLVVNNGAACSSGTPCRNFQFGMQSTGVTTSSAVWDTAGYSGPGWIATGVTDQIPANTWTRVETENNRVASE